MNRKNVKSEITFDVEMYRTGDKELKKIKRKAFQKIETLDLLSYHYFSQEYDAVRSAFILFHLYIKYGKRRYFCGAVSVHVSGMNKILRNVFFGTEFFGKYRKHMIEKYNVKAKFATITRCVLFPQFRGIGLAKVFIDIVTAKLEEIDDIHMVEIFSSMLYNFDFMPKNWIKYSNVISNSFPSFEAYSNFCKSTKLVKSVADARKMINRTTIKTDDVIEAGDDVNEKITKKKRNQVFRTAKQTHRRVGRAGAYIQRKSGSMFNRMDDADSFVNIASYMFYIPPAKFEYFCEFFHLNTDVVSYDSLLYSYGDCVDLYKSKMVSYKKNRRQMPIFLEMFKDFCDLSKFNEFEKKIYSEQKQKNYMAFKEVEVGEDGQIK